MAEYELSNKADETNTPVRIASALKHYPFSPGTACFGLEKGS